VHGRGRVEAVPRHERAGGVTRADELVEGVGDGRDVLGHHAPGGGVIEAVPAMKGQEIRGKVGSSVVRCSGNTRRARSYTPVEVSLTAKSIIIIKTRHPKPCHAHLWVVEDATHESVRVIDVTEGANACEGVGDSLGFRVQGLGQSERERTRALSSLTARLALRCLEAV
jgi:hypothetical protein